MMKLEGDSIPLFAIDRLITKKERVNLSCFSSLYCFHCPVDPHTELSITIVSTRIGVFKGIDLLSVCVDLLVDRIWVLLF